MNGYYYGIKKDLGLLKKCGHGSDFDHVTEHVYDNLRPACKKGY